MRIFYRLLLVSILWVAACTTVPAAPNSMPTAWRTNITLGAALRIGAPAVGPQADGWLSIWASETGLMRRVLRQDGTLAPITTLGLGIQSAWNATLLPAHDGWTLLWQDSDAFAAPQLYSARLRDDGTVERGPIQVSTTGVSAWAATPADGGQSAVIWSATGPQPTLYGQALDNQARPLGGAPVEISQEASAPALARLADGSWVMAWLAGPDSAFAIATRPRVMIQQSAGPLPWQATTAPVELGLINLDDPALYVETVRLGLDHDYGYLFVGLRDAASGEPTTHVLPFALTAPASNPAMRFTAQFPATLAAVTADYETGFNTGPAWSLAAPGNDWQPVAWPAPLTGQYTVLPVAFAAADSIMIGYFSGGHLAAYQPLPSTGGSLGALGLWTDRDRHLTLAWASPPTNDNAPATLRLRTTRGLPPTPAP